jgi:hypothetical protein
MPASIHTAAAFFARESFSIWDPATNTFDGGTLIGRKKRIDAFVSLWHRSTRRDHLYFRPEDEQTYAVSSAAILRHDNSGMLYLISDTIESDYWLNDSQYTVMLRAHRVMPPSGGLAEFYPVRTQGSGDDLGPVVIGPSELCYIDTELRSTHSAPETEEVTIGEYFAAYSRNIIAQEGDFLRFDGTDYRLMELHSDSGYRYARTSQESPKFQTVQFKLPSSTPAVFDPITGTMTSGTEVTREVSVLVGQETDSGRLPENALSESMTLYVYLTHLGFDPYLGQALVKDGRRYRIISKRLRVEDKQIKLEVSP